MDSGLRRNDTEDWESTPQESRSAHLSRTAGRGITQSVVEGAATRTELGQQRTAYLDTNPSVVILGLDPRTRKAKLTAPASSASMRYRGASRCRYTRLSPARPRSGPSGSAGSAAPGYRPCWPRPGRPAARRRTAARLSSNRPCSPTTSARFWRIWLVAPRICTALRRCCSACVELVGHGVGEAEIGLERGLGRRDQSAPAA